MSLRSNDAISFFISKWNFYDSVSFLYDIRKALHMRYFSENSQYERIFTVLNPGDLWQREHVQVKPNTWNKVIWYVCNVTFALGNYWLYTYIKVWNAVTSDKQTFIGFNTISSWHMFRRIYPSERHGVPDAISTWTYKVPLELYYAKKREDCGNEKVRWTSQPWITKLDRNRRNENSSA